MMHNLIEERKSLRAFLESDEMLALSDEDFSTMENRILDIDDIINGKYIAAVKAIEAVYTATL